VQSNPEGVPLRRRAEHATRHAMGDHSFAYSNHHLVLNPQGKWVRRLMRPAIVAEMARRPKFSRDPVEHENGGSRISLLQVYSS